MSEDKTQLNNSSLDKAPTIPSNDYKKSDESPILNGESVPPEMAAAISAVVANRTKIGNSTMRVMTAKEMEALELEREIRERKITTYDESVAADAKRIEQVEVHEEPINYGYPIRMTLRFLDNVISGVPHVMTIRRFDYLDGDAEANSEFPEYSRWFMSNKPSFNREDPAAYDPDEQKIYTFQSDTVETELSAFEVVKYLPYIGSTWDYTSEADPGEKTGKMVPVSIETIVHKKNDKQAKTEDNPDGVMTISIPADKVRKSK